MEEMEISNKDLDTLLNQPTNLFSTINLEIGRLLNTPSKKEEGYCGICKKQFKGKLGLQIHWRAKHFVPLQLPHLSTDRTPDEPFQPSPQLFPISTYPLNLDTNMARLPDYSESESDTSDNKTIIAQNPTPEESPNHPQTTPPSSTSPDLIFDEFSTPRNTPSTHMDQALIPNFISNHTPNYTPPPIIDPKESPPTQPDFITGSDNMTPHTTTDTSLTTTDKDIKIIKQK